MKKKLAKKKRANVIPSDKLGSFLASSTTSCFVCAGDEDHANFCSTELCDEYEPNQIKDEVEHTQKIGEKKLRVESMRRSKKWR